MLWIKKKSNKKNTLVFKTKKGIKRSKPQNLLNKQSESDCVEEQITSRSGIKDLTVKGSANG